MNTNLNCSDFREQLSAYLDSDLNATDRQKMDAHLRDCRQCADELDRMTQLLTMCAELDEGLVMPAEAGAAWRSAIGQLVRKRRTPALGAFARGLSVVAAALVLLVVGTQVLRNQGALSGVDFESLGAHYQMAASEPSMGAALRGTGREAEGFAAATDMAQAYDSSADFSSAATDQSSEAAPSIAQTTRQSDVMLIRTAYWEIESADYGNDLAKIEDLVYEYDGWYETNDHHQPSDADGDRVMRSAHMVVRVPAEKKLDDFLSALGAVGKTVSRSQSNRDISDRYTDTQTRIEFLNGQLTRLNEMMQSAQTVEDMVLIDDKSRELLEEIDSLQRTLGGWDNQVKYARVTLSLSEVTQRTLEEGEPIALSQRVEKGFFDSVEWLKVFLRDALVVLAMAAPQLVIWVPALVLVIIVIRVVVKKARR